MKNIGRIAGLVVLLTIFLQGCGTKERTTKNGLTYTVIEEGTGKTPVDGEYVMINMVYGVGDSIWFETSSRGPVVIQKEDSIWNQGGMIHEIFGDMRVGDSVAFTVSAESLFTKTWRQQVPPEINPETIFNFNIRLDSVLAKEEYGMWQQKRMDEEYKRMAELQSEQLENDRALIQGYLAENSIEAQETESGLYYVIHEEGNGPEANPMDTVSVNYTGYLLNGEIFDSSYESVARENGMYQEGRDYVPYDIVLGRSSVIRGWHEAIDLLNEGSEATVYIPSGLGYGPNAMGPQIPANSVLVFDLEIVDVKK